MDLFLLQKRLVNVAKVHRFTHDKHFYKRVLKRLGWSKRITDIVLNAYSEFVELKIVCRDWNSCNILPSWSIRQVWKIHVLDTKRYLQASKGLCGHVLHYYPDYDHESTENKRQEYTKCVYLSRFNRTLKGSVWDFDFVESWQDEYKIKESLKAVAEPAAKTDSTNINSSTGKNKAVHSPKKLLPQHSKNDLNTDDNRVKTSQYDPIKPNSFYKLKNDDIVSNESKSQTVPKKHSKRSLGNEDTVPIITRSMAKKQRLSL